MYVSLGFFLAFFAAVAGQGFRPQPPTNNANSLACGFSCTRQASFSVLIDGQSTTARCTDQNADPKTRCSGCCAARALAANLQTTSAAGFPSTNGVDCVCCILNNANFCNNF